MNNPKILIGVLVMVVILVNMDKPEPQSLVPDCFDKSQCKVSVEPGFCEVIYDCMAGKCVSSQVLCPEDCSTKGDEDRNGLSDCGDPACFDSPYCPCEKASFNWCKIDRCYCSAGLPSWVVSDERNWCQCF